MSERKFQVPAGSDRSTYGGIGPAGAYRNEEPYPVEVTVRRVAEKVVFEANLCEGIGDDNWWIPQYHEQEAMRGRGYYEGQRVRVTIEPLP